MFLSEARLQVHQFLATQCPAELEQSPAGASEEVVSFDVLVGGLHREAHCDFLDLTGGPD